MANTFVTTNNAGISTTTATVTAAQFGALQSANLLAKESFYSVDGILYRAKSVNTYEPVTAGLNNRSTWTGKPAPASYIGYWVITDIGTPSSMWYSNGTTWRPGHGGTIVLNQINTDMTKTDANATEDIMWSYTLPTGMMGPNDTLAVSAKASWTGTVATKSLRLYLNNSVMAAVDNGASASVTGTKWNRQMITNRNSYSSQIGEVSGYAGSGGQLAGAFNTAAVDTSAAGVVVSVKGQFAAGGNVGSSIVLTQVVLELIPGTA